MLTGVHAGFPAVASDLAVPQQGTSRLWTNKTLVAQRLRQCCTQCQGSMLLVHTDLLHVLLCCCASCCGIQISNLAVHTALQRIQKLETTLQLQSGEARQLVLRAPQLLVYNPAVLGEQMESLTRLMDNNFQAARSLVLQEPKVLPDSWLYVGPEDPHLSCITWLQM